MDDTGSPPTPRLKKVPPQPEQTCSPAGQSKSFADLTPADIDKMPGGKKAFEKLFRKEAERT